MRSCVLPLVLIAAFAGCQDRNDLAAPVAEPSAKVMQAVKIPLAKVVTPGSTVCVAAQEELQGVVAQLQVKPNDAELIESKDAFAAIVADVCN